jgi:tRNA G37 N-methylase TrmD
MTARLAAARAWSLSRNRSLNVWSRSATWRRVTPLEPGREAVGDSAFGAGRRLDQALAAELSALDRIVLICGRYEGVDERISEHLADREVSIGDYVLSGGELGAAVIVDTVTRLIPGAVGNQASTRQESFTA